VPAAASRGTGARVAQCCRPRSASIGNHLSDADVEASGGSDYHNHATFPHRRDGRSTSRRHHTLDGYCRSGPPPYSGARRGEIDCCDAEDVFLAHGRRLASMTSFHSGVASSRSVSSKSEKSSRSSQSPSVENLRHGTSPCVAYIVHSERSIDSFVETGEKKSFFSKESKKKKCSDEKNAFHTFDPLK
jgi:hypothetical protein